MNVACDTTKTKRTVERQVGAKMMIESQLEVRKFLSLRRVFFCHFAECKIRFIHPSSGVTITLALTNVCDVQG